MARHNGRVSDSRPQSRSSPILLRCRSNDLGDGERIAVGVAEGEHGWDAGPAEDVVGVDPDALEGGVRLLGVVGGESDTDRPPRRRRRVGQVDRTAARQFIGAVRTGGVSGVPRS
jgi:hypothetical protein